MTHVHLFWFVFGLGVGWFLGGTFVLYGCHASIKRMEKRIENSH